MGRGMKRIIVTLGVLAAASFGFAVLTSAQQPAESTSYASQFPNDPNAACDQDAAKGRMVIAMADGVVKGVEAEDGAVLIVRRSVWDTLPLDGEKRLASSLDCSIAGPGRVISAVHVRDELAGGDLATFDSGALLNLRKQGFSRPDRRSTDN
jgi:hypothetical protein